MKHNKVGSVMTTDVVRATYGTPFKEVARLLAAHRISGLPVVDEDDKVIGVISETDLVARQAATPELYEPRRRFALLHGLTRGARRQAAKVHARTAGRLMTEPPVTAHADDTIVEAARTMAQHQVERLPVLDETDRLVGIVTRRDLLQVFLRPDGELRDEVIEDVLVRTLWLPPRSIDVSVVEGVVTLTGHMERKSETEIALSTTRRIGGVVGVVDRLTYRLDDAHLRPQEQALHGVADDWLRRV
ncbi:CBS domain-containing protein [Streptomyces sp. ME08-AFT2]|uniref:CBS domain-containing protein n=1 Tax=Streptomyces TaxID=1883 RepID=UPI000A38D267|nr:MULTISPECIES: CBS domain-containing protein [Streptomyces]MDX2760371.1 CBS domain-containing protein [Streptomyces europaeiscabiei]MDX3313846.1 CBS domain-containing protein [Streptomyces sp. ME08-AFT2]MDX3632561.1 CBS domain-containing protein [Streptomyces europaeiscabiei]MDX3646844.1 CBS domain-containing protein [Streptomyces europaeiscabiei]